MEVASCAVTVEAAAAVEVEAATMELEAAAVRPLYQLEHLLPF